MTLAAVLRAAAAGRPPEPDGRVDVLPRAGPVAGVVAFSARFFVCADVDRAWVGAVLPAGDYSAPHGARFLTALADRLGTGVGALDVVLARTADQDAPAVVDDDLGLTEIDDRDHPRVVRALRYREDVRVWRTPDAAGHVLVGRGLAGRWETAFEVEPTARGRGLGRRLAGAATHLVPPGRARVGPGLPRPRRVAARRPGGGLPPGLRRGPAAGDLSAARARGGPGQRIVGSLSPCGGSGGRWAGPASP